MGLFVCFNGFHLLESLTVSVRIFYENNLKSFLILGLGKIYLLMKEYIFLWYQKYMLYVQNKK